MAGLPRHSSTGVRRRPAGRDRPPGQIGLGVVAIAAGIAALVAITGSGETYWFAVPGGLAAATLTRTGRPAALAAAVVALAALAPALASSDRPPALWAALLVPAGAFAVLECSRRRLERERDGLRDFALTDPLTRIANRRFLLAQADQEVARHHRADRPFAVVMIDLDGFKALNDRFGHAAGDDLLRDVATALARAMRAQDTVARIGGDEFCVLAPETDVEGARRLVARVEAAVTAVTAGTLTVRGSVGAAVFPDDAEDPAALMHAADERLFVAKRARYRERPAGARRAA